MTGSFPSAAAGHRAGSLVLAAAALAGCAPAQDPPTNAAGVLVRTTAAAGELRGATLAEPYTLPALRFVDTAGRAVDLAAAATTPVTLVFFGYTSCPDVCNAVLADVAAARRRLPADLQGRIGLLFVTVDPERDTPAVIRSYLERFDPSFRGLTADPPTIEAAASRLGIALTGKAELRGGGYEVGHSAQLIGFGPDRRARVVWVAGTPVGDLRHDFAVLAQGRS